MNYTSNLVLYLIPDPPPSFFLSLLPVSDSKFPKEAFSISATDEAANTVEEQEDVDECQLYLGQLCQHTCTNIWGSYRCGCHQGYILQQDGHSCAPGTVTHHGRLIQTWSLWLKSSGFCWQNINHVWSNGFSAWGAALDMHMHGTAYRHMLMMQSDGTGYKSSVTE